MKRQALAPSQDPNASHPTSDASHFPFDASDILRDPGLFSIAFTGVPLRAYQLQVAHTVLDSVIEGRGLTFAVMMSRQAGKNETAAQLEALLLLLFADVGGWLVKASPTFQPQALNSLLRLEARLQNPWTRGRWRREQGRMVRLGQARALFLSAQPTASVVGATASILLEADEAQEIPPEKGDKEFRPMAAATNATTVLWGTAWTPDTLLARTAAALAQQEAQDGIRRVFRVPWPQVAAEVPAYGAYVQGEIARLGATHPLVRTQYALQELDAGAGLFPPARQALMRGDHAPHAGPQPGAVYALCVDVAGEDTLGGAAGSPAGEGRDCTACTLFQMRLVDEQDPLAGRPRYLVVARWWWRGLPQAELYTRLADLAAEWSPRHLVVDATGLGAGVASFLERRFGSRVRPFIFTAASKSDLGWAFLSICDTGRFKDHTPAADPAQDEFWRQVAAAEALPAPARRLRWGVRHGHDDLLISAALCAVLEGMRWASGESVIIPRPDPIDEINRAGF